MIFLALTLVFRKNELISHFDLYFTLFFVDLRHTLNKKSSQAFSFTNFNELKKLILFVANGFNDFEKKLFFENTKVFLTLPFFLFFF